MNKNNSRYDVHMYKEKPNAEFQFLRGLVCFHPLGQATYTFYINIKFSIDM
jgi:hypothetical protein